MRARVLVRRKKKKKDGKLGEFKEEREEEQGRSDSNGDRDGGGEERVDAAPVRDHKGELDEPAGDDVVEVVLAEVRARDAGGERERVGRGDEARAVRDEVVERDGEAEHDLRVRRRERVVVLPRAVRARERALRDVLAPHGARLVRRELE